MTIFGGYSGYDYGDQISLVQDCGLRRAGTLPMKFQYGSCNTFQKSNGEGQTLLCFGASFGKSDGKSDCYRYNN